MGWDHRIVLKHVHQVIEHEVSGVAAVLDGLHVESHGEVALPHARRTGHVVLIDPVLPSPTSGNPTAVVSLRSPVAKSEATI